MFKIILFLVAAMLSLSFFAIDFKQHQRLANQENFAAQILLGGITGAAYCQGNGVRQNYAKAIK